MSSNTFTCNSCATQFKSSDLQRYHMKTDWHRYNLKRRVAELPPINADEFAEKLQISQREMAENQVDEFGFAVLKPIHNKHAGHRNARRKHHSLRDDNNDVITGHNDMTKEEMAEYMKLDELQLKKVLSEAESVGSHFSNMTFESERTNTDYGEDTVSEYSFTSGSNFGDYTTEEEDPANDSRSEVSETVEAHSLSHTSCIYCGVENKEVERNIKHMFHNHGLYIPERSYLTDLPGLLNFLLNIIIVDHECLCCNFQGSSLESIRAHMNSKRHCRMPYETKEERELFAPFYDFSSLEETEEKPKKKTAKKIHFQEDDTNNERHDINSNFTTVTVDERNGMEMTLPSGTRLGHRSGQIYYRQNLPSQRENGDGRRTVTSSDRRLVSGVTEKQYKQGLKKMQQLEKRAQDDRLRKDVKRMNFQMHYRDELLQ